MRIDFMETTEIQKFLPEFRGSTENFLPGYSNMAIQIHFLQSNWQERYLILILIC